MARTASQNATYPQKIAALILIAFNSGHPFKCHICKGDVLPGQKIAFDHGQAVGRGGSNTVEDIFPVHDERIPDNDLDCHTRKTAHPRGPHTAIGGDTFEAAKTDRIAGSHLVNKPALRPACNHCGLEDGACICAHLGGPKPEPKRVWPSRKLEGAPFQKKPEGYSSFKRRMT